MSTLLETLEPPEAATAAVRVQLKWFGTRRSVTTLQKHRAADMFDAESKFVSMGKKLLDTQHPAWKKIVAVRSRILTTWRNTSLPFPEPGVRLIRRCDLDAFTASMNELRDDLREAEANSTLITTKSRRRRGNGSAGCTIPAITRSR